MAADFVGEEDVVREAFGKEAFGKEAFGKEAFGKEAFGREEELSALLTQSASLTASSLPKASSPTESVAISRRQ